MDELLEELGALRQRVERARAQPRRHHEVAGALGRRGDEHGRLDLDEALPLDRGADGAVDLRADAQVALHAVAAQVDVAVAQPEVLVDLAPVVERERRRLGHRQHLDRAVADLDLTGAQPGVDRALGPVPHHARDAHHVLAAQVGGPVDDALHDARAVAQVDEGQVLAVLAAPGHPAGTPTPSTDVGDPQLAAVVGAQALGDAGEGEGRRGGRRGVGHEGSASGGGRSARGGSSVAGSAARRGARPAGRRGDAPGPSPR